MFGSCRKSFGRSFSTTRVFQRKISFNSLTPHPLTLERFLYWHNNHKIVIHDDHITHQEKEETLTKLATNPPNIGLTQHIINIMTTRPKIPYADPQLFDIIDSLQ